MYLHAYEYDTGDRLARESRSAQSDDPASICNARLFINRPLVNCVTRAPALRSQLIPSERGGGNSVGQRRTTTRANARPALESRSGINDERINRFAHSEILTRCRPSWYRPTKRVTSRVRFTRCEPTE